MSDSKTIAAIIVTYNRKSLLEECLEALSKQTVQVFDIIVVDNASSDGTGDYLKEYGKEHPIVYYNTGANIGGAGGFNYGLRKAYELGYEYYWLMDDDTIPKEDALEKLLEAKEILKDNYGFLNSVARWIDGNLCEMNAPGFIKEEDHFTGYQSDVLIPIKRATFVSFFVPREIVKKVGLPIKDFFIWSDDTNFCIRIMKYAPGYWVTNSEVIHKMKVNNDTNLVCDASDRLDRYEYDYRNRLYNSRIEHKLGPFLLHVFKRFVRILITSKDRKSLRIKYMMSGVWKGFFFNPEIEYLDE